MIKGMTQMSEVAPTFDEALSEVQVALHEARREFSGALMAKFPDSSWMQKAARKLRKRLRTGAIEFNAITDGEQVTICTSQSTQHVSVPIENSLCVISASMGLPLAIDDVKHDPMVTGHPASHLCHSWASYPVFVNGVSAGTVCAIEPLRPRRWTVKDQEALQDTAEQFGKKIQDWLS